MQTEDLIVQLQHVQTWNLPDKQLVLGDLLQDPHSAANIVVKKKM